MKDKFRFGSLKHLLEDENRVNVLNDVKKMLNDLTKELKEILGDLNFYFEEYNLDLNGSNIFKSDNYDTQIDYYVEVPRLKGYRKKIFEIKLMRAEAGDIKFKSCYSGLLNDKEVKVRSVEELQESINLMFTEKELKDILLNLIEQVITWG